MRRPPSSARPRPRPEAADAARSGGYIVCDGAPPVELPVLLDRWGKGREPGCLVRDVDPLGARLRTVESTVVVELAGPARERPR